MAGLARELCLEDTWSRPTNNVYQIRLHLPTTPNLPHPFQPPSLLTKSLYYDHWKSYVFHRLLTVTFLQQPTSSGHGTDTESYHILLHPLLLKTNKQLIKHCIFICKARNLIDWGMDKQMEVNFLGLAQPLALLVEVKGNNS